ncbi:hypothetical protein [Marinitoga sp. 38H-ov]|uniref:hypothetical protein n=1 Tax=Marinitoga sp. 38H-ov TaxID=1755814 RepID=UPI0013EDE17F|nr:hypothetical protein [Marinitoga sp. 38H-ov]KAF2956816.1 hypothetical protein AS160_03790 [Marinitoga sp. 38H-ov]
MLVIMRKLIIIFLLFSITTMFSMGLTLEFKEKDIFNIQQDNRSYFDVFGRVDLFVFCLNVPLASNNYYLNDFSQIIINPKKEINEFYLGINIIKRSIGIFPLRLAVESKISKLNEFNNYLITLESGINFGNNLIIEAGVYNDFNKIINMDLKWIFGFNIILF